MKKREPSQFYTVVRTVPVYDERDGIVGTKGYITAEFATEEELLQSKVYTDLDEDDDVYSPNGEMYIPLSLRAQSLPTSAMEDEDLPF